MLLCSAVARAASASPAEELREAVDRLISAGNYTWEEKTQEIPDGGRLPRPRVTARGETIIDGFTRAQIRRAAAVLWKEEAAYAVAGGWRHRHDLSTRESNELREKGVSARHVHPLPHEALTVLWAGTRDVRKEPNGWGGEIVASLLHPEDLEGYLKSGKPIPTPPTTQNRLGLPVPVKSAGTRPTAPRIRPDLRARYFVYATAGVIERLEVEFLHPSAASGPGPWKYIVEFSAVGRTKVDVPPEARALFPSAPPSP